MESVPRLADLAVQKIASDRWILLVKALAEYRAGRFESVSEWILRVAPKESGPIGIAWLPQLTLWDCKLHDGNARTIMHSML